MRTQFRFRLRTARIGSGTSLYANLLLLSVAPDDIIGMMSAELTVIYEPGEQDWWIATVPEVRGAFSQGRTKDEARDNVIDALKELMAARVATGEKQQIARDPWLNLALSD